MEDERDYLISVKEGKDSRKSFSEDSVNFERIYLLSDLSDVLGRVYRLYNKSEYAFNVFKNDLDADRSYLRDDGMLFFYMLLNLLSLYLLFQTLNVINRKYSVMDVLLIPSRIKFYNLWMQEVLGEIPKK